MQCQVVFPPYWVDRLRFETALQAGGSPHAAGVAEVRFRFPIECKMKIDAAVQLLSLANQLTYTKRKVVLDFEEGESGTMGYLNRMGFFDHLTPSVDVRPSRPTRSGAKIHRGSNGGLVRPAGSSTPYAASALRTSGG